ncbi:hypothetical protein GAO09_10315 [Rhizobiales bacterium RZME27]|uniref:Uncharacterized protein n=1 Tax=Endobacterium cereale TaxID=2663029 RepID=A0A6A8A968_9HYPH|nr:hypothetical protein [Endobacterium cereale]MEB2846637.1 hypothetical protein [Endobacterium cereale]MQY46438.1 hypothetical protein [Endobacterium cereale]
MGDSENSRTVPAITCRNLLKTTELLLMAQSAGQPLISRGPGEDALREWRAWRAAFQELDRLNAEQQRLEEELLEMVSIDARRGDAGLISLACVLAADDDHVRAYRHAEQTVETGADIEDVLASKLSKAAVTSLSGIVAKLHCVLERGQPNPDYEEFPWPELRRLLRDLLCLGDAAPDNRLRGEVSSVSAG